MINADSISIQGDRAWLLYRPGVDPMVRWKQANRPCDTCDGRRWSLGDRTPGLYDAVPCKDCIDGRHCFDIEVEYAHNEGAWQDLTVHVIEVLPIVGNGICGVERHVVDRGADGDDWHVCSSLNAWEQITLPPAAAPGQWAVELAVHKEET